MTSPFIRAGICHFMIQRAEQRDGHTLLSGDLSKPGQFTPQDYVQLFIGPEKDGYAQGKLIKLDPEERAAAIEVETNSLNAAVVVKFARGLG